MVVGLVVGEVVGGCLVAERYFRGSEMKLPVAKEEDGKRMMMMSGTSSGRKGLICERRETSLAGGHEVQGVQLRANMDLGSGDTPDYYTLGTDIQNNYEWDSRLDSHDFPAQPPVTKTHFSQSTSTPSPPPSLPPPTPPTAHPTSSSSESINQHSSHEHLPNLSPKDNPSPEKSSTLAVVEDSNEPSFTANESNPTVPAPTEPSKTSTLRLSDRTRSESEDDIEKMEEPEQEGALIGHKTLYKAAAAENSPNSEKTDKNGNRSELDQTESDNDCVVQCLYYTIQCCECVIF